MCSSDSLVLVIATSVVFPLNKSVVFVFSPKRVVPAMLGKYRAIWHQSVFSTRTRVKSVACMDTHTSSRINTFGAIHCFPATSRLVAL